MKNKKHTKAQIKKPSSLRKKVTLMFKVLLVFGLLYFLAKKGFISVQSMQQAFLQWQKMVPAMTALAVAAFLGVIRWQWLLKAQNIHLDWLRTFQLTFIGNFFNIALPGAVSGDFVKAFYVGKEVKGQRARAFGSILFDRVAGLSALVLVSAGALITDLGSFLHTPLISGIRVVLGVGAASVIFFYTYLFLVREKHDPVLRILKGTEKRFPRTSSLTRIYESLRHYHHHRWTVTKVLLISILIHLTVGWGCLYFAQALGDLDISLRSLYVVVPIGLLITAVPVAPAGVGTGNVAFLYFFQLIHSERGADVYSLVALTNILIGFIGGMIYFRFRSEHSSFDLDSLQASEA
jgi:uncharacterized protein (TIRG00374 family)